MLVRIIARRPFEAWQKASKADIPVEPIIRFYYTKDGRVRVYTRFVVEALNNFVKQNPKMESEVNRQKQAVLYSLDRQRITHGHVHDANFVIRIEGGKPVVRLIDLDAAMSL